MKKAMMRKGRKMQLWQIFVTMLLMPVQVFAQQSLMVTGTVTFDDIGEPLYGAYVKAVGDTASVLTDTDGNFSLSIPASVKQITVSYVGCVSRTLDVQPVPMNIGLIVEHQYLDKKVAKVANNGVDDPDKPTFEKEPGYAYGADVSWITEMETKGRKFYTPGENPVEMELMQLLRDYCNVNAIRLRVWVNPTEGWNNIDDVVQKAQRAEKLGLRTMIDFHLSDNWADPGKQVIPEAWKDLPFEDMKAALAGHVTECLTALKNAGVEPEWVQIGNETTPGFMLPVGSVTDNPEGMTELNNAGYDAVKRVFPDAKVIVHLDGAHDRWRYERMFDALEANGGKYDMIGVSVYYYWAEQGGYDKGFHAYIDDCKANIAYLKQKYGKPVMICEIGHLYNEPQVSKDLITGMLDADAEGIFYWEPESDPNHYKLGCFDNDTPTIALDAFKH